MGLAISTRISRNNGVLMGDKIVLKLRGVVVAVLLVL